MTTQENAGPPMRFLAFRCCGKDVVADGNGVAKCECGKEVALVKKEQGMTKQEIIDELNAAKLRGFDNWFYDHAGDFVGGDFSDEVVRLHPDRAAREAAALRRNREALSLDAVMPLLEVCGDHGKKHGMEDKRVVFSGRISETTYGDIIAVVEAWKARRQ